MREREEEEEGKEKSFYCCIFDASYSLRVPLAISD